MSESCTPQAVRQGRLYRGVSSTDRVALRRERLVGSAVALFGSLGFGATTIKAVCTHAALTERSFYESFASREDLLQTAYRHCAGRLETLICSAVDGAAPSAAARMAAALDAYFGALRDPALARIVLFEMDGVSPATGLTVRTVLESTSTLIRESICRDLKGAPAKGLCPSLLANGVMGAVFQLAKTWCESGYARPQDEIVRHCHAIFMGTIAYWELPA